LSISPVASQVGLQWFDSSDEDSHDRVTFLEFNVDLILGKKTEIRSIISTPAQADLEAKIDRLGREDLISGISAMLTNPKQGTPFTVGIFGDWGSGKSSLFKQICHKLTEVSPGRFYFATFNAWQFEHIDNIPAGFAQRIVQGLSNGCNESTEDVSEKNIKKEYFPQRIALRFRFAWARSRWELISVFIAIMGVAAGSLLVFLTPITDQPGELSGLIEKTGGGAIAIIALLYILSALSKLWQHPLSTQLFTYLNLPKYSKHLGFMPVLRDDIKALCDIRLGGKEKEPVRLIVFVDDLDRCSSNSILRVFEAIRLVMDIEHVVIFVALDFRIAAQAVAQQYSKTVKDNRPVDDIARDYLSKIFQMAINLEHPDRDAIESYVRNDLFPGVRFETKKETKKPVIDDKKNKTKKGESQSEDTGEGVRRDVAKTVQIKEHSLDLITKMMEHSSEELEHFKELAVLFGFSNPRLLRRMRNSYRLLKVLERKEGQLSLMNMLFWQEYLNTLDQDDRDLCENAAKKKKPLPKKFDPEKKKATYFIRKEFSSLTNYNDINRIVQSVLIPRHIIREHKEENKDVNEIQNADKSNNKV
jgi:hypothetical protein